jgi:hypothetical protein
VYLDLQYAYPTGPNNGRISSMTDGLSGEQVAYQYDSLNRLMAAAGAGWSQVYQYDGLAGRTSFTTQVLMARRTRPRRQ